MPSMFAQKSVRSFPKAVLAYREREQTEIENKT